MKRPCHKCSDCHENPNTRDRRTASSGPKAAISQGAKTELGSVQKAEGFFLSSSELHFVTWYLTQLCLRIETQHVLINSVTINRPCLLIMELPTQSHGPERELELSVSFSPYPSAYINKCLPKSMISPRYQFSVSPFGSEFLDITIVAYLFF